MPDKPTDTGRTPLSFRPARTEPRADRAPEHAGPGDGDYVLMARDHALALALKRLADWHKYGKRD